MHLTVSPAFLEKLEEARLALSHSLPGATVEDVLSAGLDLILDRDRKRKGLVANPRSAPVEPYLSARIAGPDESCPASQASTPNPFAQARSPA